MNFFSINYYTPFLKLAFPCLFSLPSQILALFQGSAKSLLPQCACPDCPAHTENPICILESVSKCPLVISQVQMQPPAQRSHEVPYIPFSLFLERHLNAYYMITHLFPNIMTLNYLSVKGKSQELFLSAGIHQSVHLYEELNYVKIKGNKICVYVQIFQRTAMLFLGPV